MTMTARIRPCRKSMIWLPVVVILPSRRVDVSVQLTNSGLNGNQRDELGEESCALRASSRAARWSLLQARAAAIRVSRLRPNGVSSYSTRGGFSSYAVCVTKPSRCWLMLTPPALLERGGPRTGGYQIGGETVPQSTSAHLSYADLAVAVIDEIDTPRHHRTRISIFN